MGPVALVVGAVASVAGAYSSYRGQKKAAKAQSRQQALNTRRSRRQAIRGAQIARAQAVAAATNSGSTGSSASVGGIGSLGSRLGAGLGFSTQMSGLSNRVNSGMSQAARGQAIGSLGNTLFNLGGGADAFEDMFKQKSPFRYPDYTGTN